MPLEHPDRQGQQAHAEYSLDGIHPGAGPGHQLAGRDPEHNQWQSHAHRE
jgi:hypothetical protein